MTLQELSDVPILARLRGRDDGRVVAALRAGADDCVAAAGDLELAVRAVGLLRRPPGRAVAGEVHSDEFLLVDGVRHRVEPSASRSS